MRVSGTHLGSDAVPELMARVSESIVLLCSAIRICGCGQTVCSEPRRSAGTEGGRRHGSLILTARRRK